MSNVIDDIDKYISKESAEEFIFIFGHALICIILIYCLWKQSPNNLAIILIMMLSIFAYFQNKFSIYFIPVIALAGYIVETFVMKLTRYPWRYENIDYVPIWKIPFWGIVGYDIAVLAAYMKI